MTAYENDVLIIPKKYKKMSVSELKKEEQKLWKKIKSSKSRQKKKGKTEINVFWNLLSLPGRKLSLYF